MHIDSYQFGRITIDGETYTNDCKILAGSIIPNWWRRSGHSLAEEDITDILKAKPDVLIVGCGAYGIMKIPEQARNAVKESGVELIALKTEEAVHRFNELAETEREIAGAFHLTC